MKNNQEAFLNLQSMQEMTKDKRVWNYFHYQDLGLSGIKKKDGMPVKTF